MGESYDQEIHLELCNQAYREKRKRTNQGQSQCSNPSCITRISDLEAEVAALRLQLSQIDQSLPSSIRDLLKIQAESDEFIPTLIRATVDLYKILDEKNALTPFIAPHLDFKEQPIPIPSPDPLPPIAHFVCGTTTPLGPVLPRLLEDGQAGISIITAFLGIISRSKQDIITLGDFLYDLGQDMDGGDPFRFVNPTTIASASHYMEEVLEGEKEKTVLALVRFGKKVQLVGFYPEAKVVQLYWGCSNSQARILTQGCVEKVFKVEGEDTEDGRGNHNWRYRVSSLWEDPPEDEDSTIHNLLVIALIFLHYASPGDSKAGLLDIDLPRDRDGQLEWDVIVPVLTTHLRNVLIREVKDIADGWAGLKS